MTGFQLNMVNFFLSNFRSTFLGDPKKAGRVGSVNRVMTKNPGKKLKNCDRYFLFASK
jgi:hypothetical protein